MDIHGRGGNGTMSAGADKLVVSLNAIIWETHICRGCRWRG